jgi:alpha-D-xyloside xylohydrolase
MAPTPVVHQQLDRFLGRTRPVDLVVGHDGDGVLRAARFQLGELRAYGSTIEAGLAAPEVAPSMEIRARRLAIGVERTIVGRADAVARRLARPGLIRRSEWDGEPVDAALVGDPVRLHLAGGRLVARPHALESLRRHSMDWPEHEHQWQVLHRYAYPLGCTADDDTPTWFVSFDLPHDEVVFGLGEDFGPLDKRGTRHHLWAQEAYSNASPARYKPVPFLWSSAGWGVLVNTTNPVRVDVGASDHTAWSVAVEGVDHLDLVTFEADGPADLLRRYAEVTGFPRVPPRWSFGAWMGRMSYTSAEEIEAAAAELRRREIPCDVMHVDTHWFAADWACDYRFDPVRFPDPAAMLDRLRADGFRVCLWQWPNALVGTDTFTELAAIGALARDADGAPVVQDGFVGPAGVIDWSHPGAVAWVGERIRDVLAMGVASIKTDFGEGAPVDAVYHHAGLGDGDEPDDGWAMHGAYPLRYDDAIQAVLDEVGERDGEPRVLWARSGWAGSQRHPIHWSGDGVARWEDMACVVRSMLSMGLSGIPFTAHDVGGFSGVPDPDLYVRWAQLGVLSPHVRFHGFPPREPWAFGPDAERIVRDALRLRYGLLPHLWRIADECGRTGTPMVRAMIVDHSHDPTCWRIDDQYQLGHDLLVAPVLTPTGRRRVYLPDDGWCWFDTGEVIGRGWHTIDVPLDRIPLFRRRDATIDLAPPVAHTGQLTG